LPSSGHVCAWAQMAPLGRKESRWRAHNAVERDRCRIRAVTMISAARSAGRSATASAARTLLVDASSSHGEAVTASRCDRQRDRRRAWRSRSWHCARQPRTRPGECSVAVAIAPSTAPPAWKRSWIRNDVGSDRWELGVRDQARGQACCSGRGRGWCSRQTRRCQSAWRPSFVRTAIRGQRRPPPRTRS
jgi:hypothetical protein